MGDSTHYICQVQYQYYFIRYKLEIILFTNFFQICVNVFLSTLDKPVVKSDQDAGTCSVMNMELTTRVVECKRVFKRQRRILPLTNLLQRFSVKVQAASMFLAQ